MMWVALAVGLIALSNARARADDWKLEREKVQNATLWTDPSLLTVLDTLQKDADEPVHRRCTKARALWRLGRLAELSDEDCTAEPEEQAAVAQMLRKRLSVARITLQIAP